MSAIPDPRIDRLYKLLPSIYRVSDTAEGYTLQALLRVITEQVNIVEDNIAELYADWFIETADEWSVPYIGDLIGYAPAANAGQASDDTTSEGRALNRILIPRREVANTIRYRRRKGTLAILELLAGDVAGWPARAVEFFKLLGWNQNINHLHLDRARTVDLRRCESLNLVDGPFDRTAHTVDIRRIDSTLTLGRYNIPSVGVFVWRLKSYSITHAPAYCAENTRPNCYTFSVLGNDAPLFINPQPQSQPTDIALELDLPAPIRVRAFAHEPGSYYGVGKSMVIWTDGWGSFDAKTPLPLSAIIPADLSNWQYAPPANHIAVDPALGRMAFPPGHLPKKGVRVSYQYGFSTEMGGGEYTRAIFDPPGRNVLVPDPADPTKQVLQAVTPNFYRVGEGQKYRHIADALEQWQADKPWDAVIEFTDNSVHVEPIYIELDADHTLQLRAAVGVRPVIRLLDWQTEQPNALAVTMSAGSRIIFDGLLIMGRPAQITGPSTDDPTVPRVPICGAEVVIRHCTLVPGWGLGCDCGPQHPTEPSLELYGVRAVVRIEHSILGSIQVNDDEVEIDPIPIRITNSILDATQPQKEAIGSPGYAVAHALLTIKRTTVFGIVNIRAVELAEDCIFNNCMNVARRQLGCMRFCYVPPGCRTPRRYSCQPDGVQAAVMAQTKNAAEQAVLIASGRLRVRPQFTSIRYGRPGYAQLGETCADEIKSGASDESEMGAFHDLFQPQREANLIARLNDYTPASMDVGLILAT